ncbi:MAG: hypothetical protein ACRCVW_04860 [Brevinema sp.]
MRGFSILIYIILFIIMIFFLNLINQIINFPVAKITNYEIVDVSTNSISISFKTDRPALIYWRVFDQHNSNLTAKDLTNLSSIQDTIAYGGGIIDKYSTIYTNHILNLSPKTTYFLYSIATPTVGFFPNKLIEITFTTK